MDFDQFSFFFFVVYSVCIWFVAGLSLFPIMLGPKVGTWIWIKAPLIITHSMKKFPIWISFTLNAQCRHSV